LPFDELRRRALRQLLESHAIAEFFASRDVEWEGHMVAAHHKLFSMEVPMTAGDSSKTE
jgi:hypothetical protein